MVGIMTFGSVGRCGLFYTQQQKFQARLVATCLENFQQVTCDCVADTFLKKASTAVHPTDADVEEMVRSAVTTCASLYGESGTPKTMSGTAPQRQEVFSARAPGWPVAKAEVKPEPAPVLCEVTSEPSGGMISINGNATDAGTPAKVFMAPHRLNVIAIDLPGFIEATQRHDPGQSGLCPEIHFALRPAIELRLGSQPEGADVSIDGKPQGPTPLVLKVEKASHVVVFSMQGRVSVQGTLDGSNAVANLDAILLPAAFLDLKSEPAGASVWVDGVKILGKTPTAVELPAETPHSVSVAQQGFLPATITLKAMARGDFDERTVTLQKATVASLKACATHALARMKELGSIEAASLAKKKRVVDSASLRTVRQEAATRRFEAHWCSGSAEP